MAGGQPAPVNQLWLVGPVDWRAGPGPGPLAAKLVGRRRGLPELRKVEVVQIDDAAATAQPARIGLGWRNGGVLVGDDASSARLGCSVPFLVLPRAVAPSYSVLVLVPGPVGTEVLT